MKKFITLLLVLTGMVCTASATDGVFYLKKSFDSAPYIHVWDSNNEHIAGEWPGTPLTTTVSINGVEFYKYAFTYTAETYSVILNWEGNIQSAQKSGLTGTTACSWDGNSGSSLNVYDYSVSKVEVRGSFNSWTGDIDVLTLENGVYSGIIDLTSTLSNTFKVVVTNGAGDTIWLGWDSLTLTDTGSLLSEGSDTNYSIANSYKTCSVSVSFPAEGKGTMSFAGVEARNSKTYTIDMTNAAGWENVNYYLFDDNNVAQVAWPGTAMTNDGDGTFSATFTAYEPYPTKVIFNGAKDESDVQTHNLFFIEDHAYTNLAAAKYYVVGDLDEFGGWDHTKSTALMTDDDSNNTFTYSAADVTMNSNTEFKIVKMLYDEDAGPDWYPGENQIISIPVAGKYNIEIDFNAESSQVTKNENTKTYEAVTIGSTGWATTVTNSALDFSGCTFKAYTATVEESTVTLKEVSNVQAETGLVLKGTNDTYYVPVTASSETDKGSLKYSSTATYTVDDSYRYCYGLYVDNGTAQFTKISNGEVIPARKAFLEMSTSSGARELNIIFDESTGIQTVDAAQNNDNAYYTLTGLRMAQPQKGLFIVNGKKVVMK